MTKSRVACSRGHRLLRPPAERPSCAISVAKSGRSSKSVVLKEMIVGLLHQYLVLREH